MWVTQTYLGTVEPDAKVFIYYLFEDYRPAQQEFTEAVQKELERLGEVFGEKVSLLMPNPRYAGRIEAEVREFPELWMSLRGNLPGLFISTVPLAHLTPTHDACCYIPFKSGDPASAAHTIQHVRRLANDYLNWEFANQSVPPRRSFAGRIWDAMELKPGVWGFRVDLKKIRGK